MSIIRLATSRERRGSTSGPMSLDDLLRKISPDTDSGVAVDSESAMRLSAVYGARRIIAYTIAGLPADVLRRDGAYRREYEPQPPWLLRPNKEQLWPEFIAQAVDSLLSDGNLFLDVSNRNGRGPSALFVVNPEAVIVGRTEDKKLVYLDAAGRQIPNADIVHVRALTLPGSDRGLSPIAMARQEIGIGQAAQKFSAKFYVNGATVSALLEFPDSMTQEQVVESARTFKEMYAGADKAHSVAAIAGGTYKPMAVSQKDAQFLESRLFTVVDIGTRIYGIPAHRLGAQLDTPQFGNSVEQFNHTFVQDAIMPWTTLLEAAFSNYILSPPAYLKFNINGLLRGDAASRAAYYQTMRQQLGVLNGDEVRALEDMNPMPNGKGSSFWMPANTYLVGDQGFPVLPERQPAPSQSPSDEVDE